MSNWASVVVVWGGIGDDDEELREAEYQNKYRNALDKVAEELAGVRRCVDVIWSCGAWGTSPCCENVARLSVNNIDRRDVMPAIEKYAPFLLGEDQELQVWVKTEDDERYEVLR